MAKSDFSIKTEIPSSIWYGVFILLVIVVIFILINFNTILTFLNGGKTEENVNIKTKFTYQGKPIVSKLVMINEKSDSETTLDSKGFCIFNDVSKDILKGNIHISIKCDSKDKWTELYKFSSNDLKQKCSGSSCDLGVIECANFPCNSEKTPPFGSKSDHSYSGSKNEPDGTNYIHLNVLRLGSKKVKSVFHAGSICEKINNYYRSNEDFKAGDQIKVLYFDNTDTTIIYNPNIQ